MIDPFEFSSRKVGDRVSVSCVVSSGDLPLNISWFKDGKRVTRNIPGIRVQVSADSLSVDLRPDIEGLVWNESASQFASFHDCCCNF